MDLKLTASERKCYRGHVDTFDVEGTDPASVAWLGGWDLWCRTCGALVLDVEQRARRLAGPVEEGVVGYVISVPVTLTIVEATPAERFPEPGRELGEWRSWGDIPAKKGESSESS